MVFGRPLRPSLSSMTEVTERAISAPAELRASYDSGITRSLAFRRQQIEALAALLTENTDELCDALHQDLRKHPMAARASEIATVSAEIEVALKHLTRWLSPKSVSVPMMIQPAKARTEPEPLGVVLIIAPWNYPVQLSLVPVLGALAAGNCVVLKPSETAPATSALLTRLLTRYLDPRVLRVLEGDGEFTVELLKSRFDHILYTGSTERAKTIMHAAAEHLTPVTLALGGKSPCYVDRSTDLAVAARRICWGRYLNAGQTCVAPDYVLATPDVCEALVVHLQDAITSAYGIDPQLSESYERLIDDHHFERVRSLLSGDVRIGGQSDPADRYIAPTVIMADEFHPAMADEIFGPILPIIAVPDHDAAIDFIRARPRPLALYVFSEIIPIRNAFAQRTSSGSISFNAPMLQLAVHGLPFGGVGESGMGQYRGEHSISTFSHNKAVFSKPLHPDTMSLLYAPFSSGLRHFVLDHVLGH